MSTKHKRPSERPSEIVLGKPATKRDLWNLIAAFNKATRALEERIEALEAEKPEKTPLEEFAALLPKPQEHARPSAPCRHDIVQV